MTRHLAILGMALLFLTASCGKGLEADPKATGIGNGSGESPEPASKAATPSLGVEELMRDVDSHRGEVVIEGVVSAVSASERRVALIDAAEFEHCGVVTCAEYTLPIRWTGELPTEKERVRVRGRVGDDGGKLIFVASHTEKSSGGEEKR